MGHIRIISNVDEEGKLHIPEKLTLKKGKVELIIISLTENEKETTISYSDHYCGRVMTESLRRDDIYGDDAR
jgi:hypothetical protein